MGRFRALLVIAVLMAAPMFVAGAAGAAPEFGGTFTVTPNPVVAGNRITFSGTGCLRDQGAPAGSPLTVIVDAIVPQAAAARAAATRVAGRQPMSDSPLQATPDAKGNWSVGIDVPDSAVPGNYQFSAVCDRYSSSDPYRPVTLAVQVSPDAPAEILLLDFLSSPSQPQLTAGKPYEFVGLGFAAGEKVQLSLHSSAVLLGTFTADPQFGFIDEFFTVPTATANGSHSLTFAGLTSHKTVTLAIGVIGGVAPTTATSTPVPTTTAPTSTAPTTTTPVTSTTAISLASTGTAAGQTLWFGAILTLLGVTTLLLARRRSQRAH